jgi:hypothetical protein
MALVPIFRPAPFGLARRWRDPDLDAKPAQPEPAKHAAAEPAPEEFGPKRRDDPARRAAPARKAPAPLPIDQDEDDHEGGPETGRTVKQRLANVWGVSAICRRSACRRARDCRDGGACIAENRAALEPHLVLLRAHLRTRMSGQPVVPPEAEPEPAPSNRRRRSSRRRKARKPRGFRT